jgi:hypothetical protein
MRPAFYHVHNGHGHYRTQRNPANLEQFQYIWLKEEEHKLFTVHKDFPKDNELIEQNVQVLNGDGYVTRNGAFYLFSILFHAEREVVDFLNRHEGISIPSRPDLLQSWKGYWHIILQNNINLYRVSNQHSVVGGKVTSMAFNLDRYF